MKTRLAKPTEEAGLEHANYAGGGESDQKPLSESTPLTRLSMRG